MLSDSTAQGLVIMTELAWFCACSWINTGRTTTQKQHWYSKKWHKNGNGSWGLLKENNLMGNSCDVRLWESKTGAISTLIRNDKPWKAIYKFSLKQHAFLISKIVLHCYQLL